MQLIAYAGGQTKAVVSSYWAGMKHPQGLVELQMALVLILCQVPLAHAVCFCAAAGRSCCLTAILLLYSFECTGLYL